MQEQTIENSDLPNNKPSLSNELIYKKQPVKFDVGDSGVSWITLGKKGKQRRWFVPFDDILNAEPHTKSKVHFVIYGYLLSKTSEKAKGLPVFQKNEKRTRKLFPFECPDEEQCLLWIQQIRKKLFNAGEDGVIPTRKYTVLVNPAGGKGKAMDIWNSIHTMFDIAGIQIELIKTARSRHATEIAKNIDINANQGLICISGDGLLYEVVNGLMQRPDWQEAVKKITIGIIAGGSGNGLAASIGCLDPFIAAYHIIKGNTTPLDICSVLHSSTERSYTFLSLTWGLVADVDFESEKYRFMGGFRFTFTGGMKIISKLKLYKGRLTYLLDENSTTTKNSSENSSSNHNNNNNNIHITTEDENTNHTDSQNEHNNHNSDIANNNNNNDNNDASGPALKYIDRNGIKEEFRSKSVTIEDEFSSLTAVTVPCISYDAIISPRPQLAEGNIHLLFTRKLSKAKLTQMLLGLEEGKLLEMKEIEQHRVKAFVLEPISTVGNIMLDGEHIELHPVQMEVHPALMKLFSPESHQTMFTIQEEIGDPSPRGTINKL